MSPRPIRPGVGPIPDDQIRVARGSLRIARTVAWVWTATGRTPLIKAGGWTPAGVHEDNDISGS